MSYLYIASPYSHPEFGIRETRYLAVMEFLASMLHQKIWCYSPVVHLHELNIRFNLPTDAAFWQDYNEVMLSASDGLLVLQLEGWTTSKGVTAEREFAASREIPIRFRTL